MVTAGVIVWASLCPVVRLALAEMGDSVAPLAWAQNGVQALICLHFAPLLCLVWDFFLAEMVAVSLQSSRVGDPAEVTETKRTENCIR